MSTIYNTITIWYNHYGKDECLGVYRNRTLDQEFLEDVGGEDDYLLDGLQVSDLFIEIEGPDWKMYTTADAVGFLCIASERDYEEVHEDYEDALAH